MTTPVRAAEPVGPGRPQWAPSLTLVPGAVLAVLLRGTCPACVATYMGALSTLGLGVAASRRVLTPLMVGFLVAGVVAMAWSARRRRRAGPFVVTLAGTIAVAAGHLVWNVPVAAYAGAALLLGAAVWNLWLKRPEPAALVQIDRMPRAAGAR
ncbi:MAG: MerC family mercury resistance protein [Gemmatimonadales bacterium]